jgi:NADPH:quinone reductase
MPAQEFGASFAMIASEPNRALQELRWDQSTDCWRGARTASGARRSFGRHPRRLGQLRRLSDDLRRLPDAAEPAVPGTDAAGVVAACGEKVKRFRPGDRVACENWFGGFAERMTAKASKTARLPDNTDFIVGSTLLHIYLTAWYALVDRARLQAGESVLITGASGGVGLACVELAHLLGARVIAAVGGAAKESIVREYGTAEVIDYSREDVRDRVKALTGDEGLDVCVENVGGSLFTTLARLMR